MTFQRIIPAHFSGKRKSFPLTEGQATDNYLIIKYLSIGTRFVPVGCLISLYETENDERNQAGGETNRSCAATQTLRMEHGNIRPGIYLPGADHGGKHQVSKLILQ